MEGVFLFGCPLTGEVAPISQCSDPTFAQGMLGPGAVIRPAGCQVLAPAGATVEFTLSTKHALIHVGMDTNKLEGHGFRLFVQTGDQVKRGDKLLEFDPQVMAKHHCNLDTPLVFCNCGTGWKMELLKTGLLPAGEDFLRLTALPVPRQAP